MDIDFAREDDVEVMSRLILPKDNALAVRDPLRAMGCKPVILLVRKTLERHDAA
jgi:hypothetical protein